MIEKIKTALIAAKEARQLLWNRMDDLYTQDAKSPLGKDGLAALKNTEAAFDELSSAIDSLIFTYDTAKKGA
jgi:hypothetical protein